MREILAYQPNGPYYIGGYSHGGRVALEMALQLEARGEQVGFIGIIDTAPFHAGQPRLRYAWRWLLNLPSWFRYDFVTSSWATNVDRIQRGWRFLCRRIADRFGPTAAARAQVQVADVMDLSRLPDRIREVYQRDFDAFLAYRPSAPCGDVTVFRSKGSRYSAATNRTSAGNAPAGVAWTSARSRQPFQSAGRTRGIGARGQPPRRTGSRPRTVTARRAGQSGVAHPFRDSTTAKRTGSIGFGHVEGSPAAPTADRVRRCDLQRPVGRPHVVKPVRKDQ